LPPDRYSELASYGQAKLGVILWGFAYDRRHASRGVRANALHPGDLISTGIDKDSTFLRWAMRLARPFSRTPARAAATSVALAVSPAFEGIGGKYFIDGKERAPSAEARDEAVRERLWEKTLALLDR